MSRIHEQIQEKVEDGEYEYAAESPAAILSQSAGRGGGDPRPVEPPVARIQEFRTIADTDPHVGEAIETLVDYLVGSGFTIQPANIPGTDEQQTDQDIAELKRLVEVSTFESKLASWVRHALIDGTGFLELVVENDHFRPKVLPTQEMQIQTDEFGNITQFIQEPESGDPVEFDPHEVAILRFTRHPKEQFGNSVIEKVQEQADMLRDMEIDTARFVATKAYPPILWQCGTDERPWTQDQIDDWLENIEDIEPETMLAVGHDVEADVVGVTSTSSTAGAMRLEETFKHLMQRIATGTGVPADLMNTDTLNGNELQTVMPKFDRRIQRYRQVIKEAVRYQIFPSLLEDSIALEFDGLPPDFEFGKHSSEEERLKAEMAIQLVNNGLLSREAAAKRLGIDPETELPTGDSLNELLGIIQQLQGAGDAIQNPDGGRPSGTGGGTQSGGREANTRDNPQDDQTGDADRPSGDATQE